MGRALLGEGKIGSVPEHEFMSLDLKTGSLSNMAPGLLQSYGTQLHLVSELGEGAGGGGVLGLLRSVSERRNAQEMCAVKQYQTVSA